jgi:hypothetical protein
MDPPTARDGPDATRPQRLDSWKEIAACLKRDVRTAQRWEKLEGLPVHRHLHDERATAYAFTNEIDEWRNKRRAQEHDSHRSRRRRLGRALLVEEHGLTSQPPVWAIALDASRAPRQVARATGRVTAM